MSWVRKTEETHLCTAIWCWQIHRRLCEAPTRYLHGWVFVVGRSAGGQLDGGDAETPDVCLEVVAANLQGGGGGGGGKTPQCCRRVRVCSVCYSVELHYSDTHYGPPTCSMTSGAIQQGVPTKVFRTLFLVMSPPAARKALTPKSAGGGRERRRKTMSESKRENINIFKEATKKNN